MDLGKIKKNKNLYGFALLAPTVIILAVLIILPTLNAINLSLHSQLIYEDKGTFVGFDNYINNLFSPQFWNSFKTSIQYTFFTVFLQVIIGILIALVLNTEFKGRGLARAFVLLPFFMPTIATCLMWRWLLNDSYGIVNQILAAFGMVESSISWLGDPKIALWAAIMVGVWRYFPYVVINVLARLQTIPPALYEAVKIDGANSMQSFRYITLPELKNVLIVVILLRWVFMFDKFDPIWILTRGGPGSATEVLPILSYNYTFQGMQLGNGAAIAMMVFLCVLTFILIYLKLTRKVQKEG